MPVGPPRACCSAMWTNRPRAGYLVDCSNSQQGLLSASAASTEEIHDRQQDDGAQQGDQHGGDCERIVDGPDVEDGAQEVTSQERAHDGYDDIDQQVRTVMHDLRGHPADHCRYDEVDYYVH